MKTTIDIADDLLIRAKDLAKREETTIKQLTEEGLRVVLEQRELASHQVRIEPFVVTGHAPAPDLSWDRLREELYGEEQS